MTITCGTFNFNLYSWKHLTFRFIGRYGEEILLREVGELIIRVAVFAVLFSELTNNVWIVTLLPI